MNLLGLVCPGMSVDELLLSQLWGPSSKDGMNVCCPMIVLTLLIVFFLGYLFGKLFRNEFSGKGLGKECGRCQHKNEVFDDDWEREGEVVFFMTRAGTKVHFSAQCQGLHAADPRFLIRKGLCKYCQQKGRHGKTKGTSGRTPSSEDAGRFE